MGESILGKEGLLIDILKNAMKEENIELNILYLPTKRAMSNISFNKSLAYIGIYETFDQKTQKKLEKYPLIKLRFLIFYLKKSFDETFSFKEYSDLKSYSIGIIPGITEIVAKKNNLNIQLAPDLKLLFKKISRDRNDMGIAVDLSIKILLEELFKKEIENFIIYEKKPFVTSEATLLLNKEHPDYKYYAPKFRKGIKTIMKNGVWLKVMEKYYGKGNVPQESIDLINNLVRNY